MNNKNNLVTVYITNFNYGRYIRKAIESVLNQTFQNYELIIIDDGSTDDSQEIIEEFKGIDNIEIVYQKNKGLNISNNIAIKLAKGKYIVRLDADDYLDENFLSILVAKIESDDQIGLIFSDYFLIDQNGEIQNVFKRNSFKKAKDEIILDMPAHGACTLFRIDAVKEVGNYSELYKCQDGYEMWLKLINKYKVWHIPTPLFYYRQHQSSLTRKEKRILNTRISIKEHKFNEVQKKPEAACIIPIRDLKYSVDEFAMEKILDDELLIWILKQVLLSTFIKVIYVSTSSKEIIDLLKKVDNSDGKIKIHFREQKLTRYNVSLADTIDSLIKDTIFDNNISDLVVTSIRYPFLTHKVIDDAIRTKHLFRADSVITVRPDNNRYYIHDGSGLKQIMGFDKFSILEREQLYRFSGGITVTDFNFFQQNKKLIDGRVGHVIIPQEMDFIVNTQYDLAVANIIAKEKMHVF